MKKDWTYWMPKVIKYLEENQGMTEEELRKFFKDINVGSPRKLSNRFVDTFEKAGVLEVVADSEESEIKKRKIRKYRKIYFRGFNIREKRIEHLKKITDEFLGYLNNLYHACNLDEKASFAYRNELIYASDFIYAPEITNFIQHLMTSKNGKLKNLFNKVKNNKEKVNKSVDDIKNKLIEYFKKENLNLIYIDESLGERKSISLNRLTLMLLIASVGLYGGIFVRGDEFPLKIRTNVFRERGIYFEKYPLKFLISRNILIGKNIKKILNDIWKGNYNLVEKLGENFIKYISSLESLIKKCEQIKEQIKLGSQVLGGICELCNPKKKIYDYSPNLLPTIIEKYYFYKYHFYKYHKFKTEHT